jgi:hypothetical protein
MQSNNQRRGLWLRTTFLTAAAILALPLSAVAKDLPPTPEGAQKLSASLAIYLGKLVVGESPPVSVSPEGAHYLVAVDLAALAAPFKESGFSIDPAIVKYEVTEQDDATWRVASDSLPPLSIHTEQGSIAYAFNGYKFDGIYDPALGAFKNAHADVGKVDAEVHLPDVDETIAIGAAHVTQSGTPAANGATSLVAQEDFADLSAHVSASPAAAKADPDAPPVQVLLEFAKVAADIGLDGMPMRKALDLWAFAVAHPSRPEIASNEPAFKSLLRALLPADLKLAEKVNLQKLSAETPKGIFGVADGKFGLAAAWTPGPKSSVEFQLSMAGITLPAGLTPPATQDLVPTAFDFDVKASGFDLGAGAGEAIDDMHFAGDGPVISEADGAKIAAKMKGAGAILVDLMPSHVVAPAIDLTIEGQAHLEGTRPSGVLKVHIRNFDKTVAALKGLGQLASPQMIGGLAMAKSLAKTESDGVLTWVAEYGADGSIKVNGLPLGKAP